jgi:double-stranded uracil-DNA glycosylase
MPYVGFDPVEDPLARVLILGTLPGEESLKRCEYYAKKANSFWRIMGDLVGAAPDMAYQKRLHMLRRSGIALWDVCHSAERKGSLDAKISLPSVIPNDFDSFLRSHSQIQFIRFNGGGAARLFRRKVSTNVFQLQCETLPSTSPAHARLTYQQKLSLWRASLNKAIDVA